MCQRGERTVARAPTARAVSPGRAEGASRRRPGRASLRGMTDEADVLEAHQSFYAAFNAKDLPAMDALWTRAVPVACVHPNWNVLSGRQQVMASWQAILGNPDQPRVQSGAERVTLLGDVAYVTCLELVAGSPLAATNLFMREDGAWRLVHHHSSPVAI